MIITEKYIVQPRNTYTFIELVAFDMAINSVAISKSFYNIWPLIELIVRSLWNEWKKCVIQSI